MNALPDNWYEIRVQVLERDGHQCIRKRPDCTANLDVHHIHPKYFGGSHNLSNLITLCDRCHSARHIQLQVSLARRVVQRTALAFRRFIAAISAQPQPLNYRPLLQVLASTSEFRDGQQEAIEAALAGNDVIVVRPTGSGKSLIYQLPALLADKPSIVITPLKALMVDQVQGLWQKGIPATFINSDLSRTEKSQRLSFFRDNGFKLIYLAPERLDEQRVRRIAELELLRQVEIAYLVIDEAHSIEEWGWAFRQSYKQLGEVRRQFGNPQVIALTATATPRVRLEIAQELALDNPTVLVQGFDRPNITFCTEHLGYGSKPEVFEKKAAYVMSLLARIGSNSKTIIYVPTIKTGEQLLERLRGTGLEVEFFYSGLDVLKKANIQERFSGQAEPILDVLSAYPNNPAARKAIRAHAKCRKAR